MKRLFIGAVVFLLLVTAGAASAYVAASQNYKLEKDSLNFGGTDFSSSTNYVNSDTLGEIISGLTSSTGNNASSGYRYLETDPVAGAVLGCTDPAANNYNSAATQDDGSCSYGGGGTFLEIKGCLDPKALNYSSAATQADGSCKYRRVENSILGCLDSRATNYSSNATEDDGSCKYPPEVTPPISPFGLTSTTIETKSSPDWNFRFLQPDEPAKTFDNQMRVRVLGEKNLTIIFNYNLAITTLKTIGVTLTDPIDKTKTFSFLLHRNQAGTAYEATIAPLTRQGIYPIDIYIINYDNQTIRHIKGRLIVTGFWLLLAEMVRDQIIPMIVATGLAFGFLPSLYDSLVSLFRALGSFFGRRKKDNPWGTVYDSVTKRPLDPVYLAVSQEGKEISTAITDIDGRFDFFLPAGAYTIKANKTHYRFPSERLSGKTADELYNHLYFGDQFTTNGEAVIDLNIPLDPIDFDWNEFAKTKTNFFEFYNRRRLWLGRLYKLIFVSGFLLSIYSFLLSPSWWNIIILVLYLGLLAINRFWHDRNKPLQIIKTSINEPLPFAIIRVFLPDLNQQIKYTVADKFGRFYLLVRPGVYYYTIEEKQLDGSYLKVLQSKPVNLPMGVLTADIYVE